MILGVTGLWMGYEVWASAIYSQVMGTLVKGIQVTVAVTLVAYVSACALGLGLAVAGLGSDTGGSLRIPAALCGLGVNAGHDLNRDNLSEFLREVPGVLEVSIGHALIADALELGYTATVKDYLRCIDAAFDAS